MRSAPKQQRPICGTRELPDVQPGHLERVSVSDVLAAGAGCRKGKDMSSTPEQEDRYRKRLTIAMNRTHGKCPFCGKAKIDPRHNRKLCKRMKRR